MGKTNEANKAQTQQIFSNYSGHHVEGSYQKATKPHGKHKTNKNNKTTTNSKGFQTSSPMASPQPD